MTTVLEYQTCQSTRSIRYEDSLLCRYCTSEAASVVSRVATSSDPEGKVYIVGG